MPLELTAPPCAAVEQKYLDDGRWPAAPLREGLERVAELDGSRVALIDDHSTLTFAELRDRIERNIGALRAAGLQAEDPVVIVARNDSESAAAVLATIRAGGVGLVLDRKCGALDLRNALEVSGANLAIVPEDLREPLRADEHDVTVVSPQTLAEGTAVPDWDEPDPGLPRLVVFTSGTTRRPKGVMHSLNTIMAGVANIQIAMSFTDADRLYLSSPLGTITGILQILLATSRGGSIILEERFEAAKALHRIESLGATVLGGAPVVLELLFEECERQGQTTSSLQRINLGGTMIPRAVLEIAIDRFGIRPTRVYGSSEIPVHTASRDEDDVEARLSDDGLPLPGSEWRLGARHEGGHELQARGPAMFLGYLDRADNEGCFEDGWYCTGDLVEALPEGRIRVLGRLKDVVARKGLKIALAEVDDAALVIPGVVEAASYAVADEDTGERVALAVRVAGEGDVGYTTVTGALLAAGLAKGKLPEEIVTWTDPLPRNPSGKIVRSELAARAAGRPHDVAPRLRSDASS